MLHLPGVLLLVLLEEGEPFLQKIPQTLRGIIPLFSQTQILTQVSICSKVIVCVEVGRQCLGNESDIYPFFL